MAKRERAYTIGEAIIVRAGLRKGIGIATFIAAWRIAEKSLGPEMTVNEYADWWRQQKNRDLSRATAFREQQAFRACFPGYDTPSELLAAVGWDEDFDAGLAALTVAVMATAMPTASV